MGLLHYTDEHLHSQRTGGTETEPHVPRGATSSPPAPQPLFQPAGGSCARSLLPFQAITAKGIRSQAAMCVHIFREHSFSRFKDQFGLSIVRLAREEMVSVSLPLCHPPGARGASASTAQPRDSAQREVRTRVPVCRAIAHI